MYSYLLFAFIVLGVSAIPENATYFALEDAGIHFEQFIATYGKQYADEQEKEARFEIFKDNLENANRLNKKSQHAVFGITEAMDLTTQEFRRIYTGLGEPRQDTFCHFKTDSDIPNSNAPDSLDWRSKGIVTPVKNQRNCGSCYAFSAIGHIEGQYARNHGTPQEFSEQQIVDCDQVSDGCNGGLPSAAFKSLIKAGGSATEQQYPYENKQGQCRVDASKITAKVVDCTSYNLASQKTVKQLLHQVGPISIGFQADVLTTYTSGIITDNQCTGEINHAVLLVGYGAENGIDYWLLKNSWGPDQNEQGYFRLQRNGPGKNGACGLLNKFMATATVS